MVGGGAPEQSVIMDQQNRIKFKKEKKKDPRLRLGAPSRPGARGFAHPEPNGVTPLDRYICCLMPLAIYVILSETLKFKIQQQLN